jgi:hypothetical protein
MKALALVFASFTVAACGSSPSSPTPPAPTTFALSGAVTSGGAAIAGAVVLVVDGPNANKSATTGADGRFQFPVLQRSGFTVKVTASTYEATTRPVTLTADTALNVDLVPSALLDNIPSNVSGTPDGNGGFVFIGTGVNSGRGCATTVSGSTDFSDASGAVVLTLQWSLDTPVIIRPGAQFTYRSGPLTASQAFATSRYYSTFHWTSIPCS